MIRAVRASLEARAEGKRSDLVFVEFNAWLYRGYDDARAALMEVIATTLRDEAEAQIENSATIGCALAPDHVV